MRFYQGNGAHHHDIAVQMNDPSSAPDVVPWQMFPEAAGIVHIALDYGSREAWLEQIEHLQRNGVEIIVRGNHGMTHSVVHRGSRRQWHRGSVRPASRGLGRRHQRRPNYFEPLPTTGDAVLVDDTDYPTFSKS